MSLLAYSPLAMGALTGKYMGGAAPDGARFTMFSDFGMRFRTPIAFEAVEAYAKLAKRRGLTLTQLALGYVRSRWFVGSTIIGATSTAQLAEDIDAFIDLDASTREEIAAIQVHYPNPSH
jgi:aryl-alcohol dehydrogenase-like predicted oxidoreductase